MGFRTGSGFSFSRPAVSNKNFGQRFTSHSQSGSFGTISTSTPARRGLSVVGIAPPVTDQIVVATPPDVPRFTPGEDTPAAPKHIQTWFPRFFVRKGRETLDSWRNHGIPGSVVRQVDFRATQFARAHGLSRSHIEDIASDLTLTLWKAVPRYEEGTVAITTFTRGVLDLEYKAMKRKLCTEHRHVGRPVELDESALPRPICEMKCQIEQDDLSRWIADLIDGLDEDLRAVAELLGTHTVAQISDELGICRATVYRHIKRIQEAVRENI